MTESSYICLWWGFGLLFFFSITLSSKHSVLWRLVTAFYAIQHLLRREFYLRGVSCHVKCKVLYRSDSLRDTAGA